MNEVLITPHLESATLPECESVIDSGLKTFRDVGMALERIRTGKLYAQEFTTFEEYCRQKWQIGRRRGYQLIEAAAVAETCAQIVHIPNEGVARALAQLEPTDQRKAARMLRKRGKPTAKKAQEAVDEIRARGGWAAEKARQDETPKPSKRNAPAASIIREWWAANRKQMLTYPAVETDTIIERIAALFD